MVNVTKIFEIPYSEKALTPLVFTTGIGNYWYLTDTDMNLFLESVGMKFLLVCD